MDRHMGLCSVRSYIHMHVQKADSTLSVFTAHVETDRWIDGLKDRQEDKLNRNEVRRQV